MHYEKVVEINGGERTEEMREEAGGGGDTTGSLCVSKTLDFSIWFVNLHVSDRWRQKKKTKMAQLLADREPLCPDKMMELTLKNKQLM